MKKSTSKELDKTPKTTPNTPNTPKVRKILIFQGDEKEWLKMVEDEQFDPRYAYELRNSLNYLPSKMHLIKETSLHSDFGNEIKKRFGIETLWGKAIKIIIPN